MIPSGRRGPGSYSDARLNEPCDRRKWRQVAGDTAYYCVAVNDEEKSRNAIRHKTGPVVMPAGPVACCDDIKDG